MRVWLLWALVAAERNLKQDPRADPKLEAARAELARDAILQQKLSEEKAHLQQELDEEKAAAKADVLDLKKAAVQLQGEFTASTSDLRAANAKVASLTSQLEESEEESGRLAAAGGSAKLDARRSRHDSALLSQAAKSTALLLHRGQVAQTALSARGARLAVQAAHAGKADEAAAQWRDQAEAVENGFSNTVHTAAKLQDAVDQVRSEAAGESRARAAAVSRLSDELKTTATLSRKVKSLEEEVKSSKQQAEEKYQSYSAGLAEQAALKAKLKKADAVVAHVKEDNEEAAAKIRQLTNDLRVERSRRAHK